jgi:hypothetical protein
LGSCTPGKLTEGVDKRRGQRYDRSVVNGANPMKNIKITKKQLNAAEAIIYQQVKDPYARQDAISQLYWQVKMLKSFGNLWANTGEPPVMFCIRGQFNIPLSKEVCKALGLL